MRMRTEGSNRWEKGVDPYLAEQAAVARDPAARRADRRALDGARRRAGRAARAGARPLPPREGGPGRRARAGEGRAGGDARAPRLRARGQRLPRPDLARARPDARDRPRRGSGAVRARGRPVHAPAPAGDDRPADARAADPPAARGRARRPRVRRGDHAVPAGRRSRPDRDQARGAALDRARDPANGAPSEPGRLRRPQRGGGEPGHSPLRDRTRLPPARRGPP